MLIIRKKQIEILSQFMLKKFKDRMMTHLRRNFPDQTQNIKNTPLQTMIQTGIDKAAVYGVNTEDDVRRYLEYMVMYSPNFDANSETPWGRDILEDKNLNGTEKMNRIDNVTLFSMME